MDQITYINQSRYAQMQIQYQRQEQQFDKQIHAYGIIINRNKFKYKQTQRKYQSKNISIQETIRQLSTLKKSLPEKVLKQFTDNIKGQIKETSKKVQYEIAEVGKRTEQISIQCNILNNSTRQISFQMKQINNRINNLENILGYCTTTEMTT